MVIDLRRFELVLGRLLEVNLGSEIPVRWGNTAYPRPPFPYVELRYLLLPTATHLPRNEVQHLPTLVRVTFADATAGSERILDVNGIHYRTVADTNEEHRDAMLVALADIFDDVAAIGVGETELEVFPTALGGIWRVRAPVPGMQVTMVETGYFAVKSSNCRVVLALEAYGKEGRRPVPGEIMETIMAILDDEGSRSVMAAHRIGFSAPRASGVRDLSEIEGPDTELRAQRDLEFWIESRSAKEVVPIETIETARGSAG